VEKETAGVGYIKTSRLSDYESEENRWLWEPYIAQGTVSLIAGLGGKGKSFLSMAIAAAVTQGIPLPGDVTHLPPSNVLLKNAENHLKRMIRPRADIVGADTDRIVLLDEGEKRLTLTDDRLEKVIVQDDISLAIIDPLQAHLPHGVSMNNAESIRPVFTHLAGVAERTNCAIVLVGHVNKGNSASSDRLLGSADIFNSVLSVMLVGKIDAEDGVSALVHYKSNMDELGPSQAFRLTKRSGFEWLDVCGATASDVLSQNDSAGFANDSGADAEKLDLAMDLLSDLLNNGAYPSTEVYEIAKNHGISESTVNRAKTKIGVKSYRDGDAWVMDYIKRREKVVKG
jgi:hypothetical protein